MSFGTAPENESTMDRGDERWRDLGRVLAIRAPDVFERTLAFLEHVAVEISERIADDTDVTPPS